METQFEAHQSKPRKGSPKKPIQSPFSLPATRRSRKLQPSRQTQSARPAMCQLQIAHAPTRPHMETHAQTAWCTPCQTRLTPAHDAPHSRARCCRRLLHLTRVSRAEKAANERMPRVPISADFRATFPTPQYTILPRFFL